MPYSSEEGKDWFGEVFDKANPKTVVDVGVGSGTYARRYKKYGQNWTGIEIFEPYIERFELHEVYDRMVVADVRDIDLPTADAYIFGDVIEHMHHHEVVLLVERAKAVATMIFVSLPIIRWEQGPSEGNEHEAHLYHWTKEEIRDLLCPTAAFVGDSVGVFLWTSS